jgi:hypothetical protein
MAYPKRLPDNIRPTSYPVGGSGLLHSRTDEENARAYYGVLDRLKEVDAGVQGILNVLVNDHNEEWYATVLYRNGQIGVIEGDGMKVIRFTMSTEAFERLVEIDEELQFEWATEAREA